MRRFIIGLLVAPLIAPNARADCPDLPPCCWKTLMERVSAPDLAERLRREAEIVRAELDMPEGGWNTGYSRQGLEFRERQGLRLRALAIAERLAGDAALAEQVDRQTRAIDLAGGPDPALVVAVAFRESQMNALTTSGARVDTYDAGGGDDWGREAVLPGLRDLAVCGAGNGWTSAPARVNPENDREIVPALIPRRDLIIAYDAALRLAAGRLQTVLIGDIEPGQDTVPHSLPDSEEAVRILTLVAFAGSGGFPYRESMRDDPPGRGFGIITLVTWIRSRIDRGLNSSFEAALRDPAVRRYTRVRAAIAAEGVARMLDRHIFPDQTPDCMAARWQANMDDVVRLEDSFLPPIAADAPLQLVDGTIAEQFEPDGRWHRDHNDVEMKTTANHGNFQMSTVWEYDGPFTGHYAYWVDEDGPGQDVLCRCIKERETFSSTITAISKVDGLGEQVQEIDLPTLPEIMFPDLEAHEHRGAAICEPERLTITDFPSGKPRITYSPLDR